MAQQQPQQAIHKFVLGNKELEGKTAEFQYDKGFLRIAGFVDYIAFLPYNIRNAVPAFVILECIYRPQKRETVIRQKQRCGSWKPCGWKQSKRFP